MTYKIQPTNQPTIFGSRSSNEQKLVHNSNSRNELEKSSDCSSYYIYTKTTDVGVVLR